MKFHQVQLGKKWRKPPEKMGSKQILTNSYRTGNGRCLKALNALRGTQSKTSIEDVSRRLKDSWIEVLMRTCVLTLLGLYMGLKGSSRSPFCGLLKTSKMIVFHMGVEISAYNAYKTVSWLVLQLLFYNFINLLKRKVSCLIIT